MLLEILEERGIIDEQALKEFFYPDYNNLHDPYLLSGMAKAVKRITAAIKSGQKITIFGDYDIDGLTATAVLLDALSKMGAQVDSYIPDRFEEGYGISQAALENLKANGCQLVISVDCGITSVEEAKWAKSAGLDLIITDHHQPGAKIPAAVAVINPKLPNDGYPFKELAGVGVAFKLVQALQLRFAAELPAGQEKWLLDLVALGTVCDCVDLVGENRILVHFGMKVLAKTHRPGLLALAEISGIDLAGVNAHHLGFGLGPRLNAAGRIGNAKSSLDLLVSKDLASSLKIAGELNELNKERRQTQEEIFESAMQLANAQPEKPVLVLANPNWSHGIIGIVASKLVEATAKPVLVLQTMGTLAKGSGRSIPGFNLIENLRRHEELFERVGGHYFAAGFTLKTKNIPALQNALEADYKVDLDLPAEDKPKTLDLLDVNEEFWKWLQLMEPFGSGNTRPKFKISPAEVVSSRLVGTTRQHLKLDLKTKGSRVIAAIGFGLGPSSAVAAPGSNIEAGCYLTLNEFGGRSALELQLTKVVPYES